MKQDDRPVMVSIQCLVYNHEPYLRDCLNGFVMQKTNFRFEAIVHDDCSTDHSADIIREYAAKYPDIIKPIYETENQYSKGDGSLQRIVHKQMRGKYIAMCEGDDYWTDPNKLQIQVDFLESHPEYSMCFHKVSTKAEGERDKREENKFEFLEEREYTQEDQLKSMRIVPTCSILIRTDVMEKRPYNKKFTIGDLVVVATALTYGRIFCIGNNMGTYRLVDNGWTAANDERICKSMVSHYQGMIETFDWYKGELGYNSLRFWTFSLLTMLKNENKTKEFNRFAEDYKKFFHTKSLLPFKKYYFERRYRAFLRNVFGARFVVRMKSILKVK